MLHHAINLAKTLHSPCPCKAVRFSPLLLKKYLILCEQVFFAWGLVPVEAREGALLELEVPRVVGHFMGAGERTPILS